MVPDMKRVPVSSLRGLSGIEIPSSVTGFRPNPLTGTIVIDYKPREIDIISFLNGLSSHPALLRVLKGL